MKIVNRFVFFFSVLLFCVSVFPQEKKTVNLLFAGDAMQHQSQLDAAKIRGGGGYDYSSYFRHIQKKIESADISVVNLEVTLPGRNYTGYPCFGTPDTFAVALKDAGFDVFLTANNHCLDKGKKGLERTISTLKRLQVKHLGTYTNNEEKELLYPAMIIKNGIRIAMLNYTYDTNGIKAQQPNVVNYIDKKQIQDDIERCKLMNPDIIVANMHWGEEYHLKQSKAQERLANFLINNGVRLVIGSHPHVVQPIDIRREGDSITGIVVYSLGNFVSGMKAANTYGGMMVDIAISKDQNNGVSIDTCLYSLVYVHKPIVGGKPDFQLIPVEEYDNEAGKEKLGADAFARMKQFATTAQKAVESLW
ncbi:poly-gamma-glutamate capsule biosynthesis protein CapA/YwtB (metallophosphatase superfamily) [Dysgonomonas sp. PH5-45]|uniref:CapA family protein n=1 Tax=unclassified Dysgonomonas TaxID=2630389 RepID=UPI0024762288|nr:MULTISPECIES: CapA family protein [unclassified Dysgonomonas]MDH6353812.1 poly-gamma-glutamate capsule biosynthesis protein CapA/YwtB (metallophosphatase superfamily) [Dysgonomonas sp. PH5-45]MDH6386714.1 poly-gamma-glutamate capsule biosynthesis protein CapA/YwtB (metallophosphatase superfamily) [Dysgonomonas sp. PH5-37]